MPAILSDNEKSQLEQTIDMFEVITQSQPDDFQSLEILKEAYSKLGREKEIVNTSKRIAQAYVLQGQLSSAILEYESILQRFPDDPDVQKALQEIANKANSFNASPPIETDLIERAPAAGKGKGADGRSSSGAVEDGRPMMQKIFVDGKLVSLTDFDQLWPKPNPDEPSGQVTDPFILALQERNILPLEKSLKLLCEKSRLGYLSIERYDVDVELARTFSREVCQRWCILPFDRMSKSILVATANPFNKQAARDLEGVTKNRLIWYLTSPLELVKSVKKIFR